MPDDEGNLKKHSIIIAGHQTSVTLENIFWDKFKQLAQDRALSLSQLVAEIDSQRATNLSSAIRVFVLKNRL